MRVSMKLIPIEILYAYAIEGYVKRGLTAPMLDEIERARLAATEERDRLTRERDLYHAERDAHHREVDRLTAALADLREAVETCAACDSTGRIGPCLCPECGRLRATLASVPADPTARDAEVRAAALLEAAETCDRLADSWDADQGTPEELPDLDHGDRLRNAAVVLRAKSEALRSKAERERGER